MPSDKEAPVVSKLAPQTSVAEQIKIADMLMAQKAAMGRAFEVPASHKALGPLIDTYWNKLDKFVDYVHQLRDDAPPRSDEYVALHELYRVLNVRLVQQQRRERFARAVKWLESKHPKTPAEDKAKWLRKLEQAWGRERLASMEHARRKTKQGRLSSEEREHVLREFWSEIDERITAGDLPPL